MEPRIQYAKTADGVNIAFWTLGEGMPIVGPPWMPATNIQSEWHQPDMRRWHQRVAQKATVVRYDGRGSGLSDRDVADFSIDTCLLDLEAVVDRLYLDRFASLGGLSTGPVAIAYAAAHPERDAPGHDDSDALLNGFYSQSSNRFRVVIAGYLWAGAGLAFLWFLGHLRSRLSAAEGSPRELSAVMFGSGVVFVAMLFAAAAVQDPTYAISVDAFDEPQTQLSRAVIPHIGYSMLLYGMLAAGLTIGTASVAILQTGVFPTWMAWVGFLASLALLFSLLFIPMFALPFWVLAISILLLSQPEESAIEFRHAG